jgi:hypothetical protein
MLALHIWQLCYDPKKLTVFVAQGPELAMFCIHSLLPLRPFVLVPQDAVALLGQEMSGAVKHICASLAEQLASLASQRSSHSSPDSSGSNSSSATSLEQLQVVLHLVTSPFFRPAVVDGQLVQVLAQFLLAVPAEGPEGDAGSVAEFRNTLLHVLEAVSQVRQSNGRCGAAGSLAKADTGMCCMTKCSLCVLHMRVCGDSVSQVSQVRCLFQWL